MPWALKTNNNNNNNNNNIRTFPLGSSGGPDGITPQHIRGLLTGSTDENLQQALVDFVNLMLAGTFDKEVNSIIFGGRLIALSKKTVEFDQSVWATP